MAAQDLCVARQVLDEMRAHAHGAKPSECCGVLLGAAGKVVEAVPAPNLARDPNRFLIDPQVHIAALRAGRVRGVEVVGFYHSHPHSPAQPSARDLAEAAYPGHLYAIVSLLDEPAEIRFYRFERAEFLSVPYVTVS